MTRNEFLTEGVLALITQRLGAPPLAAIVDYVRSVADELERQGSASWQAATSRRSTFPATQPVQARESHAD